MQNIGEFVRSGAFVQYFQDNEQEQSDLATHLPFDAILWEELPDFVGEKKG